MQHVTVFNWIFRGSRCFFLIAALFLAGMVFPSPGMTTANGSPDAYEPDNRRSQAGLLPMNNMRPNITAPGYRPIQKRNFHTRGDEDWVKFYTRANEFYSLKVFNLGPRCDVVLEIYAGSGPDPIRVVDDYGYGKDEIAEWRSNYEGFHYARIRNYDPEDYGEGTNYEVTFYQPYMQTSLRPNMTDVKFYHEFRLLTQKSTPFLCNWTHSILPGHIISVCYIQEKRF